VTQLSLFSADLAEPRPEDLGGLLAAHGQAARGGPGVRLSILLDDEWRAHALMRECRVRDVAAEIVEVPPAGGVRAGRSIPVLLRTERVPELSGIADAWIRGAIKSVPAGLTLGAGMLRCWTLAAGRHDDAGFLLGLDPHAPETHEPLAAACSRAGVAGSIIGVRAGGPAVRVVGYRRLMRLAELLGTVPPDAPAGAFPSPMR
jgi:hypothetical protein